MEDMIQIPKWQFKHIQDVLRMANNIHHAHEQKTCFERQLTKAYNWANNALADSKSKPEELRLAVVMPALPRWKCTDCGTIYYGNDRCPECHPMG
jgi:rubrerythrin